MTDRKGSILLAAGGTGGHLFPAEALAHELIARGWSVHLATDDRAERYSGTFPAERHVIASATPSGKNPFALAAAVWTLFRGVRQSRALMNRLKPAAVVGFGGYPTVPPVLAASGMGIPALVHEQNAVLGRANKLLASRAGTVAMGFEGARSGTGTVVTGNPVRPAVLEAAAAPYPARGKEDPFDLLVFGGSQGAQFFADALPAAIDLLSPAERSRLRVVQQARPEDMERVGEFYRRAGIPAEVAPFFSDMARRIGAAHLVISRAGASTVSELAVIGRPAILVPYPFALDHDQAMNAKAMAEAGGAQIVVQKELSPDRLAQMLASAIGEPERLATMAAAARRTGRPDAAARLADCVEAAVAGRQGKPG